MNGSVQTRRSRLLIVEDESTLGDILVRYFEARDMEVERAASLAEAREHLARQTFDAFLLDVSLPDGDGLSLLGRAPVEKTLVITAQPNPARFESLGVRHFSKPFDVPELALAVDQLITGEDATAGELQHA